MDIDASWFRPNPKQEAFITCADRECAYIGGFGAGKTLGGGIKGLLASVQHPGTVGLVMRQTYQALMQTTKKVLLDGDDRPPLIPEHVIAKRWEGSLQMRVLLVNGSEILFRSFQDWKPEKIRSLNVGWAYVDEASECSAAMWAEIVGRLRHPAGPGQAWATSNPAGHDWMWQRFHPDSGQAEGSIFVAKTEENAANLPPGYIEHLRRTMPLEWQKRFLDASFEQAAGIIWAEYDRAVHVVPPFELPYTWRRFESLDHGRRNPTAVLWWTEDYDGNLIVFDGYYEPGLVSQHVQAILAKRGPEKYGPIIAGPDVFNRGHRGESPADEYMESKIHFLRAPDDVTTGLNRVSEWLKRDPSQPFPSWHPWGGTLGPDFLGSPRVFIVDVPGTRALRSEIPMYRWRDLTPALEQRQSQPEEPVKRNDHACDAFRYGIMGSSQTTAALPARDWDPRERQTMVSAGLADEVW